VELTAMIRLAGKRCDFSYKGGNLGKQLKQADQTGAAKVIILGEEFTQGRIVVKDMASGQQAEMEMNAFLVSLIES